MLLAKKLLSNMPRYFSSHQLTDIYWVIAFVPRLIYDRCVLLYLHNLTKDYIKWVEEEGMLFF